MATKYLQVTGGVLAYDDPGGAGMPVIMAPGIGDSRAEYRFLAPELQHRNLRAITLDLRGHGESSVAWPEYTPEAVGADMLALVRHIDAGPAILIGASMAAASAVWAATQAPELVSALVLTGPSLTDPKLSMMQKLMLRAMFAGPWRVHAWDWFYGTLYPARQPEDLPAYRARLRANLSEPGRFAALQRFLWASKAACTAQLDRLRAPVLVIMGDRDPDYRDPAAEAKDVAELLRGQVKLIGNAGHYPHVDAAVDVVNAIVDFTHHGEDPYARTLATQ